MTLRGNGQVDKSQIIPGCGRFASNYEGKGLESESVKNADEESS